MRPSVAVIGLPLALLAAPLLAAPLHAQRGTIYDPDAEGTFSIIGRDPATGELGIGVHSKTVAVGSRTRGGKGGLAIFAHQASSNPMFSTLGVELLEAGMSPQQALEFMLRADDGGGSRQVAILDIQGRTAAWTSPTISDWKGHRCGVNYCAQGNTLTGPEVVEAMARSFESSSGPLAERLLDALDAGQRAGGDRRGMLSASLMVLRPLSLAGFSDRALDLRVDEHRAPMVELRRVLNAFRSREMMGEVGRKLSGGDLPGALAAATAARDRSPENDDAWVAIAHVSLRLGRKEEALEALRRAVELNPANRRQLPANESFAAIRRDPAFLRIVR
jgi:uncharacterized Ntn-hydrolase superfamily protein